MRVKVIAKYDNATFDFVFQVGRGHRTFKWLALATAQSLSCLNAPRGRQRCREKKEFLFLGEGEGSGMPLSSSYSYRKDVQIMPSDVYTKECPFYHPDDMLSEHPHILQQQPKETEDAPDGSSSSVIYVDLVHRLLVDEYGVPILSKWARIAFFLSTEHMEERERLIEEKMCEIEGVRRRRESEALKQRLEKERPKILKMREIMMEQLYDESAIEQTMNNEWNIILSSGVLEDIVHTDHSDEPNELDQLRQFFVEKYSGLSDMYKFFSAVNSGGGTHTLEYIEFSKFLCETNIFQPEEDHSNAMLKIFLESHIVGENDGRKEKMGTTTANIHSEIHQYEFFVCIIKIAYYKYVTLEKKKMALEKKKGNQASTISKTKTPSIIKSVEMLYNDCLKHFIESKPAGTTMKAALGSDEVLLTFFEHLQDLSFVFQIYSSHEHDSESNNEENMDASEVDPELPTLSGMMNLKQFSNFVGDAELLGPVIVATHSDHSINSFDALNNIDSPSPSSATDMEPLSSSTLTVKDVRQIFSASQHDTLTNPEEVMLVEKGGERDGHQQQMVFAEFLEGIARLGILKWSDPNMSYLDKIRRAIRKACAIVEKHRGSE